MPIDPDLLIEKKSFHVNLNKHVYDDLRAVLFKRRLTPTDVFNAFALRLTLGDHVFEKFLDDVAYEKVQRDIEKIKKTPIVRVSRVSERDADALFRIIEDSEKEEKEENDA